MSILSIGGIIAWGISKIFRVEKRYVKSGFLGLWGSKKWVDYIVFW